MLLIVKILVTEQKLDFVFFLLNLIFQKNMSFLKNIMGFRLKSVNQYRNYC